MTTKLDRSYEFPPIEWDADGYPTEASLEALRMGGRVGGDIKEAARYLRQELAKCAENCCASYSEEPAKDIVDRPCLHLHFSTGGWSGAEDFVAALLSKFWIAHLHLQWQRGGHYIFEVMEAPDEVFISRAFDPLTAHLFAPREDSGVVLRTQDERRETATQLETTQEAPVEPCRECEGTGIIVYDDGERIHGHEECPSCRVEQEPPTPPPDPVGSLQGDRVEAGDGPSISPPSSIDGR